MFFTTYAIVDGTHSLRLEEAAMAAEATLSGYMLTCGIAEGLIDSNRGPAKADVGQ